MEEQLKAKRILAAYMRETWRSHRLRSLCVSPSWSVSAGEPSNSIAIIDDLAPWAVPDASETQQHAPRPFSIVEKQRSQSGNEPYMYYRRVQAATSNTSFNFRLTSLFHNAT